MNRHLQDTLENRRLFDAPMDEPKPAPPAEREVPIEARVVQMPTKPVLVDGRIDVSVFPEKVIGVEAEDANGLFFWRVKFAGNRSMSFLVDKFPDGVTPIQMAVETSESQATTAAAVSTSPGSGASAAGATTTPRFGVIAILGDDQDESILA